MSRLASLALCLLLAVASLPARADDAADFMEKFSGEWQGTGNIFVGEDLTFTCELNGNPSRTQMTFLMTGRCAMAGMSAAVDASLHYNRDTREFYGIFLGGAEGDGLDVVGMRDGEGFSLFLTRGGVQGRLIADAVTPDELKIVVYYRDRSRNRDIPVIGMGFVRAGASSGTHGDAAGSLEVYD